MIKGFAVISTLRQLPTNTTNSYGMHMFDKPPAFKTIAILSGDEEYHVKEAGN